MVVNYTRLPVTEQHWGCAAAPGKQSLRRRDYARPEHFADCLWQAIDGSKTV